MNKLLQKVAKIFLGLSMAAGVGVAVGSNNKEASPVHAAAASSSTTAPTNATWSHVMASGDLPVTATGSKTWTSNNVSVTWSTTSGNTSAYVGYDSTKGVQLGSKTSGKAMESNYTISTAVSSFGSSKKVTKVAIGLSCASSGGYSGSLANGDTISGSATSVTYYTSATFAQTTGNVTFTFKSTVTKAIYVKAIYVWYETATTQYTASLSSNSHATLSGMTTVNSGSSLNVTIVPDEHYHLPTSLTSVTMGGSAYAGYTYNSGTGAFSISSVTGAVVITCSCEEDAKYTVTYVKGDHGTGSNYVVNNQYGGSYTLVSLATAGFTADSGYGFKKWNVDGTEFDPGESITLSANTTVTAVWAEVVTLTYDKNGGTGTNSSTQVAKGSTVTVVANSFTAPSGKEFSKWNTKSDGTGTSYVKDDTFTINADTTLYAQWAPALDITISNFTEITTSYTTVFTHEYTVATYNSTTTMDVEAYGVYNNSNGIQMNSGKGTYIKNTEALPTGAYITKIICEWTATGKNSPTIYVAKDAVASTSSTSLGKGSNTVTTQTYTVTNPAVNKYNYFYFDGTTVTGACYMTHLKICYDFADEVTSIAVNATQAQLTFTVGDTFTFAGSVTPTRLVSGVGSSTTDNLTFKLGGTTITAGSYTFVKADNGKTLNVTYTENGKSVNANAPYNVIVDYDYVESVEIKTKTAELGKLDNFTFGAEVLPSTAQQDVKWSVEDKIGTEVEDGNIKIDEDTGELTVTADNGCTITITATTVGEDENGDTLTHSVDVVITGDPVVTVNDSLSGYSGKNSNLAYSFSNFTGTLSVISSDTTKVTVGTPSATTGGTGSGTVQVNFVAAGSSTLSFKDGDSVIATCTVTVTASAVESVSWTSSSNMTVYSGSTALNAAKVTSWGPQYTMNNLDSGSISSNYSIQLNGSAYTLGSPIEAGTHTVTLTYGGKTTTSSNPVITAIQSLASISGVEEYSWTAASGDHTTIAAAGSSGDFVIGGQTWSIERDNTATTNLTSGAVQIGSNGNATNFSLTSNFGANAVISKVTVQCASYNTDNTASTGLHDISISVGGTSYLAATATPRWAGNSTGPVSGTGSSKGDVVIQYSANSDARAAYLKSIVVEYSNDISNNTSHYEAQAAVVEFAQYMNEQMNGTNVCSGTRANLSTAWGNVTSKYNTLFGDGSSLITSELAFAKKMLANASANWNESHDSDEQYCLERAMKTYEWCVSKYSGTCTPFMSSVRAVEAPHISLLVNIIGENTNTVAIIVIISMVSVTAIGGYFFLRKRKENI